MKRILAALFSLSFLFYGAPLHAQTPAPQASSDEALAALVRQKIKHVFVIYQENRSFDSYFGTFPGAENLTSTLAQTQGFRQYDPLGNQWVTPFRITAPDTADANHARQALITKSDGGRMDLFVPTEEFGLLARGDSREDAQRVGLLTMAFEDCDMIPYYWQYAHNFTLFDHFFQAMYAPSTPGNIDLIAAQTGQTQWARHPKTAFKSSANGSGVPVVDDLPPAFGPYGDGQTPKTTQDDLTFATLFLTLSGKEASNAKRDDDDIKDDVASLAQRGAPAIPWGWYQEGFGATPQDGHSPYVTHHNALQYFGYLRNNDYFWRGVHNLNDLLPAIQQGTLGDRGVVFVKGGYQDPFGFKPANTSAYVQKTFQGDDDHPGYSDSQVSEAFVATFVNAIAKSKYWNDSVIFITWDDSEGFYDHMSPPQFERCPDGHPCGDGPRVPAMLISPYAKDHAIVSDLSDHTSFAKMLGRIFNLPALASLPDEAPYLPEGPRDTDPRLSDLLGGFDPERLTGTKLPIAASQAIVADVGVPPKESCSSLSIIPNHIPGEEKAPAGFAPLTLEH